MTHPNEKLFLKGYAAFQTGDMDLLKELFAEDIVWHLPGRNPMSGDYRGIDAVLGAFAQNMELTAGNFSVEIHDCLADDDHAVVLGVVKAERDGKKLEQHYTHVVHIKEGKVTESWLGNEDQYATDEFWS